MELNISYFILSMVLLITCLQDVKKRTIHIILPIAVFLLALAINLYNPYLDLYDILYNSCFILINIIGVITYFSFKEKKIINPIDKMIGLGDIVFFISITPLFKLKGFILFFISGLIFSLFLHLIFNVFKNKATIPLAGYMALFLVIYLFLKHVLNLNINF